jgi:hypothetical protein
MSWGVATQNGVSVSLASVVSLLCGSPADAPTNGFAVNSASGTSYSTTRNVLSSDGTSYSVSATVLSSDGTAYSPI